MKVYISHSTKDDDVALAVRQQLSADGHDVFMANADVLPGENWADAISDALAESDAMVVLLSPDAVKSRYVRNEISYALGSPRYEGRVLPVVVRPSADAPWALRTLKDVNVTGLSAPEAAARVARGVRGLVRRAAG
jgi:hypothetical protein